VKIRDMLFRTAGKELGWYGQTRLQPQETFKLESLAADYGKSVVEADFISWCEEVRGADHNYPVSVYIRAADARLKSLAAAEDQAEDPRIVTLSAYVFGLVRRTPHPADVKKFLAKYSLEDIQEAFKAFAEPLDEYEQKWAIKNFFRDNGGEAMVLYIVQKKEAALRQAREVEMSTAQGLLQAEREQQARIKQMEEEERQDSYRDGSKPF